MDDRRDKDRMLLEKAAALIEKSRILARQTSELIEARELLVERFQIEAGGCEAFY